MSVREDARDIVQPDVIRNIKISLLKPFYIPKRNFGMRIDYTYTGQGNNRTIVKKHYKACNNLRSSVGVNLVRLKPGVAARLLKEILPVCSIISNNKKNENIN
ncbi:hypothetical protein [Mucilaginibacter sp. 22184]|uniref:hypothetical protein n=1 Tax=Mucilaginibacter sp. 22184 TaxID=3453887 RepID=UPI003F8256B9